MYLTKKNILFIHILLLTQASLACDMCGGFMGITPYDNKSHISMFYRLRTFNGYYGSGQEVSYLPSGNLKTMHQGHDQAGSTVNSADDFEEYRIIELRSRFFLSERTEVNFSLPYYFNTSQFSGYNNYVYGIGDLTLSAGYHVIREKSTKKIIHRLVAGAGLKLPTGNNEVRNRSTEERYDILLQPGTGTTDILVHANYLAGYKNAGVNYITGYRINTENKFKERAGNGWTNYLNFFYKFQLNDSWVIVPSLQNYYEYSNGIFVNGISNRLTKMNVLYSGPGIDVFFKNLQWNCAVQLKALEEEKDGKMQSGLKLTTGFIYNFNQEKFLIKRKKDAE